MDPSFAAVIDRCLSLAPEERFSSAEALREALEALQARSLPVPGRRDRPYPGLHPFSAAERSTFCGRDAELRAVLERLRAEPLVVVAGDSGTGKSSLCRAAVMPAVAEGALGAPERWATCELLPGRRPLRALVGAVAASLGADEAALLEGSRQGPRELARQVLAAAGARGVLVFVDQLEEALTLGSPEELEPFSGSLAALAGAGSRVRILASARGDFLARLAALPGLRDHLSTGLYLLPHLGEAGLREAIVAPARGQGFAFEPESVVDALVAAGNADGGLALLQFALAELWKRRDVHRGVISGEALAAIGGVEGALARHADGVLAELRPAQRATARRLLVGLVLAEGTRARRTRGELLGEKDAEGGPALEALVRSRLVLARETAEAHGQPTYELAHEALLRGWDTLRGWLANDEEQRALRQRLERACAEWNRLGRPREQLWTGRQLAEAAALDGQAVRSEEQVFLRASRRASRRRRLLAISAALLVPFTAAAVYGGLQLQAWRARERDAAQALASVEVAMAGAAAKGRQVEELRRSSFKSFDEGRSDEGERTWSEVLKVGAEEAAAHDEAVAILDRALALDGGRLELRRRLAEVLYRSLLVAERDRHEPVRAILERRLYATDDTREYRDRLREPAVLSIETEPGGAQVKVEHAVETGDGAPRKMRWVPLSGLAGTTPLPAVTLPPGSYRLRLDRADRPSVLYPVLLQRGERLQVRVPMPA
ncbi:MAG TPA: AAA family ATPase, partial [Myxococcales bacterium]|nr:AAA family ATPase [Myxococcales bacterium]